jgi:hypothetical protein
MKFFFIIIDVHITYSFILPTLDFFETEGVHRLTRLCVEKTMRCYADATHVGKKKR